MRRVDETEHPLLYGKTVLLAEDEEMVRRVMSMHLEKMGVKVLQAEDGEQAIDMFRRRSVDMAIIDCRMPLMDGYAVMEEIRLARPDLPVVLMSGDDGKYVEEHFGTVGPNELLLKPIVFSKLRETVSKWLHPYAEQA